MIMRVGFFVLLGALACLPNPESVRSRRARFDRAALQGTVIVDEPVTLSRVGAIFDDRAELVGFTMAPPDPQRGDEVNIDLYWRSAASLDEDYLVFVHADALDGNARRIHADHAPAGGRYPTDLWQSGELIRDHFSITIPSSYGPSRLALYVGLYRGGHRLRLTRPGLAASDKENRSRPIVIELDGPSI
jgi:hypothetical protein